VSYDCPNINEGVDFQHSFVCTRDLDEKVFLTSNEPYLFLDMDGIFESWIDEDSFYYAATVAGGSRIKTILGGRREDLPRQKLVLGRKDDRIWSACIRAVKQGRGSRVWVLPFLCGRPAKR